MRKTQFPITQLIRQEAGAMATKVYSRLIPVRSGLVHLLVPRRLVSSSGLEST